jgi:hypothetical protein
MQLYKHQLLFAELYHFTVLEFILDTNKHYILFWNKIMSSCSFSPSCPPKSYLNSLFVTLSIVFWIWFFSPRKPRPLQETKERAVSLELLLQQPESCSCVYCRPCCIMLGINEHNVPYMRENMAAVHVVSECWTMWQICQEGRVYWTTQYHQNQPRDAGQDFW